MSITIGILGAGQLAQMLSIAAQRLDIKTVCLGRCDEECAGQVTELLVDAHNDKKIWQKFCSSVDLITLESENIQLDMAEFMNAHKPLVPNLKALAITQDRGHEKATLRSLNIPTAPYQLVDSREDLDNAVNTLGLPIVLKTRRFGYDGKGQFVLRTTQDIDTAWEALSKEPLIAEGFVPFDTEVSLIGARSTTGETVFYPLVENIHHQGILHQTIAPYRNDTLTQQANQYMLSLLDHLDYHGVMAIEFFVKDGALIANEMAPRVHNTGHWTIEGATVSQFEQHLRAITGLPLKPVELKGTSIMINCIGQLPDEQALKHIPHTFYHNYGKPIKALRKVGHITVVHSEREKALEIAEQVKALI
jgi:5-(carboxyamino)imidazole ribonucleotide synthase